MEIQINNQLKLSDIQDAFNKDYPYLRLKFFSEPHKPGTPTNKKLMLDSSIKIGEARKNNNSGILTIKPEMTVTDLEQCLEKEFGLHAQIFRRGINVWLETTHSDTKTLKEQNVYAQLINSM
jgi:hypothetical protein